MGKSGKAQEWYLNRYGLTAKTAYRTNVVKEYRRGNPDPTKEQVGAGSEELQVELAEVRPRVVIAVGRFAARWFLGEVDMESVHGMVARSERTDALVVPVYHPAAGMYDNDLKAVIDADYRAAAEVVKKVRAGREVRVVEDVFAGKETYVELDGTALTQLLAKYQPEAIGLDTEGDIVDERPANPWSVQVSWSPGTGAVLRCDRHDFELGIRAIQTTVDLGCRVVLHNAMFDVPMCRLMGLELRRADLYDTMYAAYLLRTEPQGLKPLAWRWCGMRMRSYSEVVGSAGLDKQLDYLGSVLEHDWERPEEVLTLENDGQVRVRQPQSADKAAWRILADWYGEKTNKEGERVDPGKRWGAVEEAVRAPVEEKLGKMPHGSLADVALEDAVEYAARDADAALRMYGALQGELEARGLA